MTDALATGPLAVAPTATPASDNPNSFTFDVPNTSVQMAIDITQVPAEIRLDFLKRAFVAYINNAVNQAKVRADKANEAFDAYEEAMKADPLQTAVAKPEGERIVADYIETAKAARERLYKGEVRRQGDGSAKTRAPADPVETAITNAVATELFQKEKDAGSKRKYLEVLAEVKKAGGGSKYLENLIEEKVAAGADRAALEKFKDERYVKPAQLMYGKRTTKATAEVSLLG